ncbi:hypothetical protein, partial [Abyssisolibacter fermentans]|uniref:hypothetical protein n=1 Tax=Abyssisolibacter fermentans TaxID=1766203 RepID=UPI001A9A449F
VFCLYYLPVKSRDDFLLLLIKVSFLKNNTNKKMFLVIPTSPHNYNTVIIINFDLIVPLVL